MPRIEIRPAVSDDIPRLIALDHSYVSDYVWQIEVQRDNGQVDIQFRETRLPRSVQVAYPRPSRTLPDRWTERDGLLVAVVNGEVVAYAALMQNLAPQTTWVTDLAVAPLRRRQGIGSALVLTAQEWALQKGSRRLLLEMQPKNHPAISLALKLGFDLCGYNDHYYPNHDLALFFCKWL
jgi:GNAT superfamily N-acetyltransferase